MPTSFSDVVRASSGENTRIFQSSPLWLPLSLHQAAHARDLHSMNSALQQETFITPPPAATDWYQETDVQSWREGNWTLL